MLESLCCGKSSDVLQRHDPQAQSFRDLRSSEDSQTASLPTLDDSSECDYIEGTGIDNANGEEQQQKQKNTKYNARDAPLLPAIKDDCASETESLQQWQDSDDEYEYEYIEEDDEEEASRSLQTTKTKEETAMGISCLHATKRKASDAPLSSSANRDAKQLLLSFATNRRGLNCKGQEDCRRCKRENHAPVSSCTLAGHWIRGNIDDSISPLGITTWPSEYVLHSVAFRSHEFAQRWGLTKEVATLLLQEYGWSVDQAQTETGPQIRQRQGGANRVFEQNRHEAHAAFLAQTCQVSARVSRPEGGEEDEEELAQSEEGLEHATENLEAESSPEFQEPVVRQSQTTQAEGETTDSQANATTRACGICMDDFPNDELMSLGCSHPFCTNCWKQYLGTYLEGNFGGLHGLQVRCPMPGCMEIVEQSHIESVAPALIPRFQDLCLDAFVRSNPSTMRWCPGPDCRQIAVRTEIVFTGCGDCQGDNGFTVSCGGKDGCQTRFCFLCGEEPHAGPCGRQIRVNPAEGEEGEAGNVAEGVDRRLIGSTNNETSIQLCPKCKAPIEKNGGCNHMTCKCGCHFCWLCNKDITSEGYGHSCGREPLPQLTRQQPLNGLRLRDVTLEYVRDAIEWRREEGDDNASKSGATNAATHAMLEDIARTQERLRHLSHYYNRFVAHHQGQQFAEGQCGCVRRRADDFSKISCIKSGTDTDFFVEANMLLVSSRRVLKYSYYYVYQEKEKYRAASAAARTMSEDENRSKIGELQLFLFQNYQQQLERYTEELSEVSERAFNLVDRQRVLDLMEVVGRSMKAVIDFEIEHSDNFSNVQGKKSKAFLATK